MPNGQFPPGAMPQRPVSPIFPTPTAAPAVKRLPPELEQLEKRVSEQVVDFASRIRVVEQRVDNLRNHLELIDSSLIEKHKSVIGEMRDVQDGMRSLRADIEFLKDLGERLAKRMEALASREEVKVLQRYVELWQPLQFVTRSEVKALIQNALKTSTEEMVVEEKEE